MRIPSDLDKRIGKSLVMNGGEIATITEYINYKNIIVQFDKTKEIVKCNYGRFLNGKIKSHFSPSIYGNGIIGLETIQDKNHNILDSYMCWASMMTRCYSKNPKRYLSYKNCIVCEDWIYYSNFKKWYNINYYKIENEKMEIDKDILIKGNKIYSPETCIFVPSDINKLFVKRKILRGECCIGVYMRGNKYRASYHNKFKTIGIGTFKSEIEAFKAYKINKENYIKEMAEKYKTLIPIKLYNSMINYIIEITD